MPDRTTQRPGGCKILRTFEVTHVTQAGRETGRETVTGPCNAPLLYRPGDDWHRGICASCRGGWEAGTNRFADEAERLRATGLTAGLAEVARAEEEEREWNGEDA